MKKVDDGVAYHVFIMKDPDYVMKIMTTYETLEKQNKFKRGGVMEKKEFMDTEVVANHFFYRHKVDENNNSRHAPISMRELGLPNLGLIVALLGTLPYQK